MKKIEIDKKNNLVKLRFNKHFYKEEFIDLAIKDFDNVCEIKKEKNVLNLKPKSKEIELETVGYEFYNYLLGLIKNI